jgi:hypothetical protein
VAQNPKQPQAAAVANQTKKLRYDRKIFLSG